MLNKIEQDRVFFEENYKKTVDLVFFFVNKLLNYINN